MRISIFIFNLVWLLRELAVDFPRLARFSGRQAFASSRAFVCPLECKLSRGSVKRYSRNARYLSSFLVVCDVLHP